MMLEEADNLNQLRSGTNRGDAGDVFPGSTNNTTFNSGVRPEQQQPQHATRRTRRPSSSALPGATMTANLRGGYLAPTAHLDRAQFG